MRRSDWSAMALCCALFVVGAAVESRAMDTDPAQDTIGGAQIAAPDDGIPQIETPAADVELSSATMDRGGDDEEYPAEEQLAADDGVYPRQKIHEAEMLYSRAIRSYTEGNRVRAQKLYTQALYVLSSADIGADTHYVLHEDFSNLFEKIKRLLGNKQRCARRDEEKYSVVMDTGNQQVQRYLAYYTRGEGRLQFQQALARSARFRPLIEKILEEYGLPPELACVPIVESQYNNNNISSAGAVGLWQLMPERARALGLRVNWWIDERKDPEKATRAACRYLKELYLMFDDWHIALAAYNRGEYGLGRDLRTASATTIDEVIERKAVPRETECFVPRFIACALIADNAADYGLAVKPQNVLAYDTVRVSQAIDLKIVARCAGSTIREIRELNPALKAWCTPRNYPEFELHLPPGSRDLFIRNISREKDLDPVPGYIKYHVSPGDRLERIAKKFNTTVPAIRKDNRIAGPGQLAADQVLMIRPGY